MADRKLGDSPVASLLPDEMIAGGLADDFDGIVREARYAPFDYMGNIEEPVLAVRLKIERLDMDKSADDDERFIMQYWSAGSLEHFRPSMDGKEATSGAGMEIEPGVYALRVGQRTALNNNTNAAQLMRSLLDAQFPREKFKPDVRFMDGIKGHWNRLPPDKKGGQFKDQTVEQAAKSSRRDVLCLTRFDGFDKAGSTPSKGSSGSSGSSSVDNKLVTIVTAALTVGTVVKKTALSGAVLKAAKGDKDVNAMVKRVTTTDFLESLAEHNILFDAEAGTVELVEML